MMHSQCCRKAGVGAPWVRQQRALPGKRGRGMTAPALQEVSSGVLRSMRSLSLQRWKWSGQVGRGIAGRGGKAQACSSGTPPPPRRTPGTKGSTWTAARSSHRDRACLPAVPGLLTKLQMTFELQGSSLGRRVRSSQWRPGKGPCRFFFLGRFPGGGPSGARGQVWEVTSLPRGHLRCLSPRALGEASPEQAGVVL